LRSRPTSTESTTMLMPQRFKQKVSLKERLMSFAKETREKASQLPTGSEKDDLLREARRADTAAHLDDWANSPGLQSPKQSS
jgi:hypothetical protein